MTEYQPHLGEILKELRAENGAGSQEEFADKIGIDVRTLRKIEKGQPFQPNSLALICHGLKTSAAEVKMAALERMRNLREEENTEHREATGSNYTSIRANLDDIDQVIRDQHGQLTSPTRAENDDETEFSSRRLVSSLASLGIPLDVTFLILEALPATLEKILEEGENFTTGQIRIAVAKCISSLHPDQLMATEEYQNQLKLEHNTEKELREVVRDLTVSWAKRYARRYGNPSQITQVLQQNGSVVKLDYQFLKAELIPHVLTRVLGEDFSISTSIIVNPTVVSEMARSTLEEFRRLGLYTIRYRTALWMAEDIAIHPPHPWIVSEESRTETIEYDLERGEANLSGLSLGSGFPVIDSQHRYDETIHHYCSAVLAIYSGFLGHKYTASIHVLRHWLSMADENTVLWQRCNLRYIDSDLASLGISKQDFLGRLKTMETANLLSQKTDKGDLLENCEYLRRVATSLYERRKEMNRISNLLAKRDPVEDAELLLIAQETAISCLGTKRIGEIYDRGSGDIIGFRGSPNVKGSILANRAPMCLFLIANDQIDRSKIKNLVDRAADQLFAHRLANTCIILTASEPQEALMTAIRTKLEELPSEFLIGTISLQRLRSQKRSNMKSRDILDELFSDG